ncbi:hypothetical protein KCP78_08425 [Salmonella enterica subsp. enterica]|nr:hypothetical protein KCP78_08425 [Salmonella enterica subsp. enterica]
MWIALGVNAPVHAGAAAAGGRLLSRYQSGLRSRPGGGLIGLVLRAATPEWSQAAAGRSVDYLLPTASVVCRRRRQATGQLVTMLPTASVVLPATAAGWSVGYLLPTASVVLPTATGELIGWLPDTVSTTSPARQWRQAGQWLSSTVRYLQSDGNGGRLVS